MLIYLRPILLLLLLSISCTPSSNEEEDEDTPSDLPEDPFQPQPSAIIAPVKLPKIDLPVATDINAWLGTNPKIAQEVIWYEEEIGWIPWQQWSPGLKQLLQDAYLFALNGTSIASTEPLTNHADRSPEEAPVTTLSFSDSRDLFFSQITWSFLVDIQGLVPWKLMDLSAEDLSLLFDGREYFDEKAGCYYYNGTYDSDPTNCYFMGMKIKSATITPAPGHWTYGLLLANNLIGTTRKSTISRVCQFVSRFYTHMDGPNQTWNMIKLYDYEGIPPLINVIKAAPFIPNKNYKPMYACWGATHFVKLLLAQANIPTEHFVATPGHRLPHFTSEGLALSHGDELYRSTILPTFPSQITFNEIFITEEVFLEWFGSQTTKEERGKNISRRSKELDVKYLTYAIVNRWCQDIKEGNSIPDGQVYAEIKDYYTLQELNEMQLWQKLAAKVETLKYGCNELYLYIFEHSDSIEDGFNEQP